MAVSPPPTTASSFPRKKKPSQVAQAETPAPIRARSEGRPRYLADAPVAMMSVRAATSSPSSIVSWKGRCRRSAFTTVPASKAAPKRSACARNRSIRSGPVIASGNPG